MGVIPIKDIDAVQFFESHIPIWLQAPNTLGLQAGQVTSMDTATKAARNAYTAQQNTKEAAKAATVTFHNNVSTMRSLGADLIKTIKAYADTTNNPNVYALAQIPPPAAPTPQPPPGQPTDFRVELTGGGAIALSWKSTNSAPSGGAFFTVRRRLAGESNFTMLGGTGSKSFIDDTVPFGTNAVTYLVQGFRGTEPGPESEQLSVQFGAGGSSVTAVKLAA